MAIFMGPAWITGIGLYLRRTVVQQNIWQQFWVTK